jgi:hypothetical protein
LQQVELSTGETGIHELPVNHFECQKERKSKKGHQGVQLTNRTAAMITIGPDRRIKTTFPTNTNFFMKASLS